MKRFAALLFVATVGGAAQFSLEDVMSAPFASEKSAILCPGCIVQQMNAVNPPVSS